MNLLEGSIAFALAMAGLATLCTVLVEILHRTFSLRARGLKMMLKGYFQGVMGKKDGFPKKGTKSHKALEEDFLNKLIGNPLELALGRTPFLFWRSALMKMDVLTKDDFLIRVKDTDAYEYPKKKPGTETETQPLVAQTEEEAKAEEVRLKELGDQYDRYGQFATVYFKDRAHLISLAAGLILALVGNIHAGRIFDAFVKNPDMAQRMEAQTDKIAAAVQRIKQAESGSQPANTEDTTDIRAEIDKVKISLDDFQRLGLPIGWAYYPNCLGDGKNDPRCKDVREQGDAKEKTTTPSTAISANQTDKPAASAEPETKTDDGTKGSIAGLIASLGYTLTKDLIGFGQWFGGLLLTGLLIGLGGPFWYDLASKLADLLAMFKGNKPPANDSDKNAGKAA